MLQAGFSKYLNEGLGYDENPHWNAQAFIYPAKWFNLNVGLRSTYNDEMVYNSGFAFTFKNYDFGLNMYFVGGYGENIKGLGFSIVNNIYF